MNMSNLDEVFKMKNTIIEKQNELLTQRNFRIVRLEQLVRDYIKHNQTPVEDMIGRINLIEDILDACGEDEMWFQDNFKNESLSLERRANELLGEV